MTLTIPHLNIPDLLTVITSEAGRDDAASARNAAHALREACGESDLTRLLNRLAEKIEWLEAKPD